MLILAIDTALDACAAGVLDTDAGKLIAQESQAMKRGHAEALMPLIARVMKQSGVAFASLDRIALATSKPVVGLTTLTAYAAPVVSQNGEQPVISAIDARHDQVYFQVVSGDGGALIHPGIVPIDEAVDASRFGAPHLVGNAANILAERWPADAPPPFKVEAQPAPDIAWVAWLGAAVTPDTAPVRPFYLRAPDAKIPKDPLPKAAQPPASCWRGCPNSGAAAPPPSSPQ